MKSSFGIVLALITLTTGCSVQPILAPPSTTRSNSETTSTPEIATCPIRLPHSLAMTTWSRTIEFTTCTDPSVQKINYLSSSLLKFEEFTGSIVLNYNDGDRPPVVTYPFTIDFSEASTAEETARMVIQPTGTFTYQSSNPSDRGTFTAPQVYTFEVPTNARRENRLVIRFDHDFMCQGNPSTAEFDLVTE